MDLYVEKGEEDGEEYVLPGRGRGISFFMPLSSKDKKSIHSLACFREVACQASDPAKGQP
jgi:hypothetical protein